MLGRKQTPLQENTPVNTVIGRGTRIKGSLVSEESLRIDGFLEGDISTSGDVIIGETGEVMATITARNCLVVGKIKGNVQTSGKLEILAKGAVYGDVKVGELAVETGAILCGNCSMEKGEYSSS